MCRAAEPELGTQSPSSGRVVSFQLLWGRQILSFQQRALWAAQCITLGERQAAVTQAPGSTDLLAGIIVYRVPVG